MKKLWLLLLPFAFIACQQANDSHVYMLKQTDSLLQRDIQLIEQKKIRAIHELERKITDPCTEVKAKEWLPKAAYIDDVNGKVSETFSAILDSFVTIIQYAKADVSSLFAKASSHAFINEHKVSERIEAAVYRYQGKMLSVDSNLTFQLADEIKHVSHHYQKSLKQMGGWNKISCIDAVLLLRQLQSDIAFLKLLTIEFCNSNVSNGCFFDYSSYHVIASVSSSVSRPNEEIIITAGLGEFNSSNVEAIINIAGNVAQPNESGIANYRFKVPKDTGTYYAPVKISFKNPYTGREETIERQVTYTVKE